MPGRSNGLLGSVDESKEPRLINVLALNPGLLELGRQDLMVNVVPLYDKVPYLKGKRWLAGVYRLAESPVLFNLFGAPRRSLDLQESTSGAATYSRRGRTHAGRI